VARATVVLDQRSLQYPRDRLGRGDEEEAQPTSYCIGKTTSGEKQEGAPEVQRKRTNEKGGLEPFRSVRDRPRGSSQQMHRSDRKKTGMAPVVSATVRGTYRRAPSLVKTFTLTGPRKREPPALRLKRSLKFSASSLRARSTTKHWDPTSQSIEHSKLGQMENFEKTYSPTITSRSFTLVQSGRSEPASRSNGASLIGSKKTRGRH